MSRLRAYPVPGGIVIEPMDEDAAYDAERQREVDAERDLKNSDWWTERLGELSIATAEALARCMTNLDAACNGCPISRDACLSALSGLQKAARADARDCP